MKRILVLLWASAVSVGVCAAQSAQSQTSAAASGQASAAATQPGAQAAGSASGAASQATAVSEKNAQVSGASHLQAGSTLQAQLVKPVDAKKNKVGDEVIAKTTHDVKSEGHLVVPKGSRLVGHVTDVKQHSKDQASQLAIAFDHAILKNGMQMPLALSIQAIGRGQASAAAMGDEAMMSGGAMASGGARSSGGGLLGGVRSTAGGVVDTAAGTAGGAANSVGSAVGGTSLSANSTGVVGLQGLSLSTQTSTSANASVISSQGSNVHLDSGTDMILRVNQ
jgi:hypothetical protein